ncbi:putative ankyrin repeat protein L25 [Smittium mucronatum]|uniref:Putative ankyrin repeat protein L25 n=1 Tax=Smittium mucronatum TaxID=133383 RepID=A0A1R0GS74_9FUNG|nr:putative ankyrin repeat protein L25 [Smittium mucronatum]
MEKRLPSEIIERIFIFTQDTELQYLSKSSYEIFKKVGFRSKFFLSRFGIKTVFDFENGLPAKYPKIFTSQELALCLLKVGVELNKSAAKLFYYAIKSSWVLVIEYLLNMFIYRSKTDSNYGYITYAKPLISLKRHHHKSIRLALQTLNISVLNRILFANEIVPSPASSGISKIVLKKHIIIDINIFRIHHFKKILAERRIDILQLLFDNGLKFSKDKYIQIFYLAISNSDIQTIQYLASKSGGIFSLLESKAFDIACQSGDLSIIKYVESHCPKIQVNPIRLIEISCKSGNIDAIEYLQTKGYSLYFFNYDHIPNICEYKNTQLFDYIYQNCCNKITILKYALLCSVKNSNIEMLSFLHRDYPEIKDFVDFELLKICIHYNIPNSAEFFIKHDYFTFPEMDPAEGLFIDKISTLFSINPAYNNVLNVLPLVRIIKSYYGNSPNPDVINRIQHLESIYTNKLSQSLLSSCRSYTKIAEIDSFVKNGADVNIENGQALINACSEYGSLDVIEYLIEAGVDANCQNGQALIDICSNMRGFAAIKYLVEHGADVNSQNGQALISVCSNLYGTKSNNRNSDDYFLDESRRGLPVVPLSNEEKAYIKVKYLVENGADVNAQNGQPLIKACMDFSNLSIVKYLVENGADIHSQNDQAFLEICKLTNRFEHFEFLIESGANINAQNGQALINASEFGDLQKVKYLIENGMDIHLQNDQALINAFLRFPNCDTFDFLVQKGANIRAQNDQALINACSRLRNLKSIKYLIKNGADVNAQNGQALINACLVNSYSPDSNDIYDSDLENEETEFDIYHSDSGLLIISYLVYKGADVNAQNGQALINACFKENYNSIVKFLIENGADAL